MRGCAGPPIERLAASIVEHQARERGDMAGFDNVLYHHGNVNDDKEAALGDSKRFLDLWSCAMQRLILIRLTGAAAGASSPVDAAANTSVLVHGPLPDGPGWTPAPARP